MQLTGMPLDQSYTSNENAIRRHATEQELSRKKGESKDLEADARVIGSRIERSLGFFRAHLQS